jgi:uncharacterized OsmC-like protein
MAGPRSDAPGFRQLFERQVRALTARPGFGKGKTQTVARIDGDGVLCEVAVEDRKLDSDQPVAEGGGGRAAHPGQLMRASLAACLAQGYRMWAARRGVAVGAIQVTLACEYDVRGQLGLDPDVPAGWQAMRIDVQIESDAAEADVRGLVAHADRLSPMLANLNPAITRAHALTITRKHRQPEGDDNHGRPRVQESAALRLGPGGQQLRRWMGAAARAARPLVPGPGGAHFRPGGA